MLESISSHRYGGASDGDDDSHHRDDLDCASSEPTFRNGFDAASIYFVAAGVLRHITKAAIPTMMMTAWTPSKAKKAVSPRRYSEKAEAGVPFEENVSVPKKMSPLIAPSCTKPSRIAPMIEFLGILHRPTIKARSMAAKAASPYACVGAAIQRYESVAKM